MIRRVKQQKELKQKLTLGISGDVIEKAKAANINISAITEKVLEAMTFDKKGGTKDDLIKAYEAMFDAAKPILEKYDATVEVGSDPVWADDGQYMGDSKVYLDSRQLIYWFPDEGTPTEVSRVFAALKRNDRSLMQQG